ncbi:Ubiquitin-protein ligase E3 [Schizosaccharomyces pombe]
MGQTNSRHSLIETDEPTTSSRVSMLVDRVKLLWKRYTTPPSTEDGSREAHFAVPSENYADTPSRNTPNSSNGFPSETLATSSAHCSTQPHKDEAYSHHGYSSTMALDDSSLAQTYHEYEEGTSGNSPLRRAIGSYDFLHPRPSGNSSRLDRNSSRPFTSSFHSAPFLSSYGSSNDPSQERVNEYSLPSNSNSTYTTPLQSINNEHPLPTVLENNALLNNSGNSPSLINHLRQYLNQDFSRLHQSPSPIPNSNDNDSQTRRSSWSSIASAFNDFPEEFPNASNPEAHSNFTPLNGNDESTVNMLSRLLSAAAIETVASIMNSEARNMDSQNMANGEPSRFRSVDGSFEQFLTDLRSGNLTNVLQNSSQNGNDQISSDPESNSSDLQYLRMFRFPSFHQSHNQPAPNNEASDTNGPALVPVLIVCMRSISETSEDHAPTMTQENQSLHNESRENISINDITERMAQSTEFSTDLPPTFERSNSTFSHPEPTRSDFSQAFTPVSDFPANLFPGSRNLFPTSNSGNQSTSSFSRYNQPTVSVDLRNSSILRRAQEPVNGSTGENHIGDDYISSLLDSSNSNSQRPFSAVPSESNVFSRNASGNFSMSQTHQPTTDNTSSFSTQPGRLSTGLHHFPSDRDLLSNQTRRSSLARSYRFEEQLSVDDNTSDFSTLASNGAADMVTQTHSEGTFSNSTHGDWLIYVFGGLFPEHHPVLSTVSLFSDNPMYEDLLALTTYLGPAKKPVASHEDVKRSGGLFAYFDDASLSSADSCLICLETYTNGDICRKLQACKHFFHQACIDQWLTTGNNSCPLCRAHGVTTQAEEEN